MLTTAPITPHPSAPPTCHGRWMSPEYEPGLVSVIVPTYNRAHLIVETLDSVFAQTYRPIELLIIDDGSSDETADVVGQWERDHQQEGFTIRCFSQENRGAPAARNLGLIESRGEFIQFLDSDDLLKTGKIRRQIDFLESKPKFDYVCSVFRYEPASFNDQAKANYRLESEYINDFLLLNRVNTLCGVYRRGICLSTGRWNERLPVGQDWDFNMRLMAAGANCAVLPDIEYVVRGGKTDQISARWNTDAGLRSVMNATLATVTAIEPIVDQRLDAQYAVSTRYYLVAMHAARAGYPRIVRTTVKLTSRYRVGWKLRARLRLFSAMAMLPEVVCTTGTRSVLNLARRRASHSALRTARQCSHPQ